MPVDYFQDKWICEVFLVCSKDFIPFYYLRSGEVKHKVDFKSLIQGLIIAGITSTIIMYRDQATLEVKINAIRRDVSEIKKSVNQMQQDFYVPRHTTPK